jgi:hypothetical protein
MQIDAARVAGVNENLANLLLAAKFGVRVCPHAGGVGLCEAVQHLSMIDFVAVSGTTDGPLPGVRRPPARTLRRSGTGRRRSATSRRRAGRRHRDDPRRSRSTGTGAEGIVTTAPTSASQRAGPDLGWFLHDRLGMFIHFACTPGRPARVGAELRADPGGGVREVLRALRPRPVRRRRLGAAVHAGRDAVRVLTTKHHEGFCLFDSDLTDYKITNTPFGATWSRSSSRLSGPRGSRSASYHSLLDWHHPDFVIDGHHRCATSRTWPSSTRAATWPGYREYLHGQARELLTRYGEISYLFYDFSYPASQQPHIYNNKGPRTGRRRS